MPRRNRADSGSDDTDRALSVASFSRVETRRGRDWTVQPISAANAQKAYRCPGCAGEVAQGAAHVVVWRADGVLGDAADLAARRHWHTQCWRIA